MTSRARKLEFFETWGTFLWFLMDAFWMLQFELAAYIVIPLAVIINLAVFLFIEKTAPYFVVVSAVNAWLLMNICWMIHDFRVIPGLIIFSKIFCALGVICIIASFFGKRLDNSSAWQDALRRLRRFRIKKSIQRG